MSNFSPKLQDATHEQLLRWVNEGNFQVVPLASDELTRRTLKKLQGAMEAFNEQAYRQTEKMIKLTRWVVILTVAMLAGLIVQIFLAI